MTASLSAPTPTRLTFPSTFLRSSRRLLSSSELWIRGVTALASRSPRLAGWLGVLPRGFDWRAYLERYPDLHRAGMTSPRAAVRHWLQHGANEGRWATAASYPTRTTLVCPSVHSLYLRATGTLVCWDDAGNDEVLQRFDDRVDYGRDVYLGPVFNRLRTTLSAGRMPFTACQRCLVLSCRSEHSSYHLDQRVIEIFQVEPSYRCTLDCPGCVPLTIRRGAPPQNLEPRILTKILADLRAAQVRVKAFDFQGHGEPLLNPRLWDLTRMARQAFPASYLTVTTNAQGVVRDSALDSGIDEVICAIDGMSQETYAPYRVHGRFDLAFRFMSDFARLARERRRAIKVIWKYVLFAHNSDREHLLAAQRLAKQAAVDELVFVFTRNGPRARHLSGPADVPLLADGVPVSFRFHEPATDDLAARLDEARRALDANDLERASELVASVAKNLDRFVADAADLDADHRALLAELDQLASRLAPADAERIVALVARLAAGLRLA